MKKVITQKQTNILSNNFYRGWHNERGVLTPISMDRITTSFDLGSHRYTISIKLNDIALVGQIYCLPEEVLEDIRECCDAVQEDAHLNIDFFLYDLPSGFNFEQFFGETSRDIKPDIFMQFSTDRDDSLFYPPVIYYYDEPGDYTEFSSGISVIYFNKSNSCTLEIATCGPAISVNWGW